MKMKVVAVAVVMSALLVTDAQWTGRPTGGLGLDLTGKMFTLSQNYGGVYFFPGSSSTPRPSTSSYPTSGYSTQSTTHDSSTSSYPTSGYSTQSTTYDSSTSSYSTSVPWTTETPTRGFSVCVRYMADASDYFTIFRLGSYSSTVRLRSSPTGSSIGSPQGSYFVGNDFYQITMTPKFKFWPRNEENMWTSICLTMDGMTNVTQLFKDFHMSVRMMLPSQHGWQGETVIEFPGFNGQVTDLQIWDYPLSYKEVYNYMGRGQYWSYRGSLLSWSYISYSNSGNSLLEDEYNLLAQQPRGGRGRRGGRGGRQRKRKLPQRLFSAGESSKGRLIF